MSEDVLISIIIPIYNVEQYLAVCLDSVVSQDYRKFEIICIEDKSTDNTLFVLNEYKKKYPQIKCIYNESNRGQAYSRNLGIEVALGEYIVFVDSDDILKPSALKKMVKCIKENQNPEIIYYDMEIKMEGNWAAEQVFQIRRKFVNNKSIYSGQEMLIELYKINRFEFATCCQAIKRTLLIEKGLCFYDGIYHEDTLFTVYCALNASSAVYMQEELYIYRRRDNSTTTIINLKRVQSQFIVFIELWNYWKNGSWTEEIDWLFKDVLKNIYKKLFNALAYYSNEELKEFGTAADQFMYEIIRNSKLEKFEYVNFNQEEIQYIKNAPEVMVYGAGRVGVEVVKLLLQQNINVKNVLVSNKEHNAEKILNVPIMQFKDAEIKENTLIIIGIIRNNERAIKDIITQLRSRSINNYIMYDGFEELKV